MSSGTSLIRRGWGVIYLRAFAVLTAVIGLIVAVGLVRNVADSPVVSVLGSLILTSVAVMIVKMLRMGVYETAAGLLISGPIARRVLPWDNIAGARIEIVTRGLRPERVVVVALRGGDGYPLYPWNARSLPMFGSHGGVDALADRINAATARHHES